METKEKIVANIKVKIDGKILYFSDAQIIKTSDSHIEFVDTRTNKFKIFNMRDVLEVTEI